MSIHKYLEKIKGGLDIADITLIFIVILVGTASYGLGRLSVDKGGNSATPNKVVILDGEDLDPTEDKILSENTETNEGKYLASRNGTKYYTKDCSGAKTINEENKIWFSSEEEAELAGYEKSSTCQY